MKGSTTLHCTLKTRIDSLPFTHPFCNDTRKYLLMNRQLQTQNKTLTYNWYVYIVQCSDNTYYTGITTDIKRRVKEHNSAKGGAKYTRPRKPVTLIYHEPHESRSTAASREYQIKQFTLKKKKLLINENNKSWLKRPSNPL